MSELRVEVWSDIACPWCHVGKRRLEQALERFDPSDQVKVVWRAFELDPSAPPVHADSPGYAERLARKYGATVADAQAMMDQMTQVAAGEGLDFHFERIRSGNTFDAHRLLHFALEQGCQDALKERLLVAYLSEGEPIGDRAALSRLASEVGLAAAEVERVLETDAYASEVRADQAQARALRITGVPFFLAGGRYAASGAQPPEVLEEMLRRGWDDAQAPPVEVTASSREGSSKGGAPAEGELDVGAACGPDGCS